MCQCKGHGPGHRPEHGNPHGHGHQEGCSCGSQGGDFKRQFYGKEEQLGKLEKYLNDLKKKLKRLRN